MATKSKPRQMQTFAAGHLLSLKPLQPLNLMSIPNNLIVANSGHRVAFGVQRPSPTRSAYQSASASWTGFPAISPRHRLSSICVSKDDQQLSKQLGDCATHQSLLSAVPPAERGDWQQSLFPLDSLTNSLRRAPRRRRNAPNQSTNANQNQSSNAKT